MNYVEKFYYKVREDLLQKRAGITKWSKVGQVIQNVTSITTKQGSTADKRF